MKKWLCLVLGFCMLFAITGCTTQGETGENNSSTPSTANKTGVITTTTPSNQEFPIFKTNVVSMPESKTNNVEDTTGVPYRNVSPDKLNNNEAREILEVLIPRQFDVFNIFQLDYDKIDLTQTIPISKWYALCTDERFTSVQDIRDFILQVYTSEKADWYFRVYLDVAGVPEENDHYPYYRDYDGKLYRSTHAEGKNLVFSQFLADTTRIVSRTENTVTVEMDAEARGDGEPREIYKFLLCQTQEGWRLNSDFLDSYLL